MAKNLVIVESPAKAKTIQRYLGKDYKVVSSMGHVRDLPSKGMSIDIEHNFKPTYEISSGKQKVVRDLRSAAKSAETVWLAADEDREGEAIAWHLSEVLKLPKNKRKRIVFHEITKTAITNAVENPRDLDVDLVDAQQARRVLDRLVGYELSPVLWKKVRRGLSAGRVQSVAVRLIVDRENEIKEFKAKSSFKVTATLHTKTEDKESFDAELDHRPHDHKAAHEKVDKIRTADFTVGSIEQKPGTRNPSPPFTTSTLQQEASRRLGFSVKQTMVLAQRLYEGGHITYMRTDSFNLSAQAQNEAKKVILDTWGQDYHHQRQYKTKSSGAQEAHEAIRPTHLAKTEAGEDPRQKRLYQLVRERTLASQMAPAKTERTTVTIDNSKTKDKFIAKGEIITFDGFLAAYGKNKKAADDKLLPNIKKGQELDLEKMLAAQTFERPPARYTEASLVKKLEEQGIGRPSTYAPTISTIQDRGYIEKGDLEGIERKLVLIEATPKHIEERNETEMAGADRNKLFPTDVGDIVTDFLCEHFKEIMDYKFTAKVEDEFDEVADGKLDWEKMIATFYKPFHKLVEDSEHVSRAEAAQARELGTDPKTKRPVFARFGRYGPMVQIGTKDDEEKPLFAPIPPGSTIDNVTLKDALRMFQLPRVVGSDKDGGEITAQIGRFGPYVKVGKLYVSLKDSDPFTVTEKEARKLIAEKRKAEAEKHIQTFEKSGIEVLNGRFGPYVTDGKQNAKIPKDQDPKKITEKDAKALLKAAPKRSRRKRISRKSS